MEQKFKNKYYTQSRRLRGWDYSAGGAYFITVCTKYKECIFGYVKKGRMILNQWGEIVEKEIIKTSKIRLKTEIYEYIVMPNHIHLIIMIDGKIKPFINNVFKSPSANIGAIIRGLKSTTTKQINILRKTNKMPVWQNNYYDHIIRDNNTLNKIREYIKNNPRNWEKQ